MTSPAALVMVVLALAGAVIAGRLLHLSVAAHDTPGVLVGVVGLAWATAAIGGLFWVGLL